MGGEKELAQRRLLDWEPGALGEPQHKEGGPSRGSRDGARAHLTKEQVFIVMSAPFASEKGVSTNKTQILCVRESSSQIPMSSHSGPTFQEMNLLASPQKAISVPKRRSSRATGRDISDANSSLLSVPMPFQLFCLPGQSFWGEGGGEGGCCLPQSGLDSVLCTHN